MIFSERDFVRRLQALPVRNPVTVGIGDDGAVLDSSSDVQQVVVTDMLIDGVHFDLSIHSAAEIGYKCMAANLSDLAAMAAVPTGAFLSLAIPRNLSDESGFLNEFYSAVAALADEHHFTIAGGDTNRIDGPFVANVCLTGSPMEGGPVLRSGAKPGDLLVVTGPLGGSLQSGRHLRPVARFDAAEWCVQKLPVHSMMDISDGLALDLHRMMESSGTGAVLMEQNIPVHSDVSPALPERERRDRALSDGEDFELLMAIGVQDLPDSVPERLGLTVIGHVLPQSDGVQMETFDGMRRLLPAEGFQHL